jgi:hypothetical protein
VLDFPGGIQKSAWARLCWLTVMPVGVIVRRMIEGTTELRGRSSLPASAARAEARQYLADSERRLAASAPAVDLSLKQTLCFLQALEEHRPERHAELAGVPSTIWSIAAALRKGTGDAHTFVAQGFAALLLWLELQPRRATAAIRGLGR